MRRLSLVLMAALLAGATAAQARESTLSMTCDEAAELVEDEGAVVLTTGRHTFDRFVSAPGYCPLGEIARAGYARTQDSRSCVIGYVCKPYYPDDDDFGFGGGMFGR